MGSPQQRGGLARKVEVFGRRGFTPRAAKAVFRFCHDITALSPRYGEGRVFFSLPRKKLSDRPQRKRPHAFSRPYGGTACAAARVAPNDLRAWILIVGRKKHGGWASLAGQTWLSDGIQCGPCDQTTRSREAKPEPGASWAGRCFFGRGAKPQRTGKKFQRGAGGFPSSLRRAEPERLRNELPRRLRWEFVFRLSRQVVGGQASLRSCQSLLCHRAARTGSPDAGVPSDGREWPQTGLFGRAHLGGDIS